MLTRITDSTFTSDVLESEVPVLLMFSAPWAGPCNLARDTFQALAGRYGNQITFAEFVLDDNPATPERCGVRSVPCFYLFQDGQPSQIKAGAIPTEHLEMMIEGLV